VAPAPGINSDSLHNDLKAETPPSMTFSILSNKLLVDPLKRIVANLFSSDFLSTMIHL
jgi:hypothetical protein